MMSKSERFKNHDLVVSDFVNENFLSDSSDSESENLEVKFLWWSKNDGAAKVEVTLDVEDPLLHGKNKRTFLQSKNKTTVIEHLKVT